MASITKKIPGGFSAKAGTGSHPKHGQVPLAAGKLLLRQVKFRRVTGFLQPLKNIATAPQTGKVISLAW